MGIINKITGMKMNNEDSNIISKVIRKKEKGAFDVALMIRHILANYNIYDNYNPINFSVDNNCQISAKIIGSKEK